MTPLLGGHIDNVPWLISSKTVILTVCQPRTINFRPSRRVPTSALGRPGRHRADFDSGVGSLVIVSQFSE